MITMRDRKVLAVWTLLWIELVVVLTLLSGCKTPPPTHVDLEFPKFDYSDK